MPFDGFFARAVAAELQALEGAKVERVNHNAKEYVELCLYLPGAGRRTLVISVCPSDARIALVDGEESRAAVLVSNGVGTSGAPVRLFAPPQVHLITLKAR